MKLLLLGKRGQVGWELQRSLAPLGELIALDRDEEGAARADLTDLDGLSKLVRRLRPDVIVNAAAYTAVDRAESEREQARIINAVAPQILAQEAAVLDAWLVHYSTDYVFSGAGSIPWRETDATSPLNVYGRTKLDGEEGIRRSGCRHVIFRTSWVHGARGHNFVRTILRLAEEREALEVIDDQVGAPTGAELLADVTAHALRAVRMRPELAGTYHVTASGETTWHEYATHVIERARSAGRSIRVASQGIRPVSSSVFVTAAKRPANSRLSTEKARHAFDLFLPHWRIGVDRVLSEILGN